jgi:hypothetical protein
MFRGVQLTLAEALEPMQWTAWSPMEICERCMICGVLWRKLEAGYAVERCADHGELKTYFVALMIARVTSDKAVTCCKSQLRTC